MWCSGDIIDWDLINESLSPSRTHHSTGSVNAAHWWWDYGTTDRKQDPTLIADVQTHETYFTILSHMFDPMRTFRIGPQAKNQKIDNKEHTSWTDLLDIEIGDINNTYTMQYIIDDMVINDIKQYRIRWEGYNEEWDTWEQPKDIQDKELITEYEKDRENQEEDRSQTKHTTPDTEQNKLGWLKKLRAAVMKHRVSQGVSKGTGDKWESVWTDALPYGNGRCNKAGEGRTKCLACGFLENKNNTETTRHAHLECPVTKRVLGMIYRCYIQITATNLRHH